MLDGIRAFARKRVSFAFETTLSGRGYVKLFGELNKKGYEIHIFFLWVSTVDLALSRVRERVLRGGHDVPEAVVRRRFERLMRNFLAYYRPLADSWTLFDNSGEAPSVIAVEDNRSVRIINKDVYGAVVERFGVL